MSALCRLGIHLRWSEWRQTWTVDRRGRWVYEFRSCRRCAAPDYRWRHDPTILGDEST